MSIERDEVDAVLDDWQRAHPDLDLQAMGPLSRLARFYLQGRRRIDRNFAEHGLALGEFDVLAALRRNGDPYGVVPAGPTNALALSHPGVSVRLGGLQAAGLVERRADPAGGGAGFALTEEGRRVVDAAAADHTATETRLLSALDETERTELDRLLRKLLAGVQEQPPSGSSRPGVAAQE